MGTKVFGSPVARSTPFDNTNNDFESTDVQAAIEEIGASASPGFSFGRGSTSNAGTYLQVDSVPSNQAGRIVPFTGAEISNVFVACRNNSTFTLEVQTRVGNVFTTIYTISLTNERKKSEQVTGVLLSLNDELAVRVGSGSAADIVVGIILKGTV